MCNRTSAIAAKVGPNTAIIIVYVALLSVCFGLYGVRFRFDHFKLWSMMLSSLGVVYLASAIYQFVRSKSYQNVSIARFLITSFFQFVKDWFPVVAIVTIYENLRDYTAVIQAAPIDDILLKWDVWLFGVEPTVWMQKLETPLLTTYFSFVYSLWIILPLTFAWLLYALGKRREFHHLVTGMVVGLCVAFILYLIFPAGPPRFYMPEAFASRYMPGLFSVYDTMYSKIDQLNPMLFRSSFPSMHVGMSLIGMTYAIYFSRRIPFGRVLAVIYSFLAISIWISTVYLRHHWVVDIFAGWAVGLLAFGLAVLIHRWWPDNRPVYRSKAP